MSCYRRLRVPGATVFFTVALAHRGGSLLVDQIDRLRLAVAMTRRERPFTIDAFVVLPDHLHCIWTLPEGDTDYSTRWGAIKSRFSRLLRDADGAGFNPAEAIRAGKGVRRNPSLRRSTWQSSKGETCLWHSGFREHHIRDDADFHTHLAYCWSNPVKHGLCAEPQEWPFSSVHRERNRGIAALLDVEPHLSP